MGWDFLAASGEVKRVQCNGKWGFADSMNNLIIPLEYDNARDFHEGLACVYIRLQGWGFINMHNQRIIPLEYSDAGDFHEGLAKVKGGNWWFYKTINGEDIVPLRFKYGMKESDYQPEQLKRITWRKGRVFYGFFNSQGEELFIEELNGIGDMHGGVAWFKDCFGYYGVLDKYGRTVVEPSYSWIGDFHEGYARVQNKNKWGYINTQGVKVTPIQYDDVEDIHNGIAKVNNNGQYQLIRLPK